MKWRCQMCGTIVESEKAPSNCSGCKFNNRYVIYEQEMVLTNKRGQTKRFVYNMNPYEKTVPEQRAVRYIEVKNGISDNAAEETE